MDRTRARSTCGLICLRSAHRIAVPNNNASVGLRSFYQDEHQRRAATGGWRIGSDTQTKALRPYAFHALATLQGNEKRRRHTCAMSGQSSVSSA